MSTFGDQRFATAADWINASMQLHKFDVDADIVDALAKCCRKLKGGPKGPIWKLRKTDPKGGPEYFAYKAFKFAAHAARWGDLSCWNEGFTHRLMEATDAERELWERAHDQLMAIATESRRRAAK